MNIKHMRLTALCVALVVMAGIFAFRTTLAQDQQFGSNWQGFYWNNQNFNGNPVVARIDNAINFNWQTGSPDPAVPSDHFSARWANTLNFPAGTYRFRAGADDGIRVAIDGNLIINMWNDAVNGFQVGQNDVPLTGGNHTIIVDYYENVGNAGVQFSWTAVSGGGIVGAVTTPTPAPAPGTSAIPTPTGPAGLPVSAIKAVIIVDLANVRSGPSTNSTPIAEVRRDEQFGVVANNGANTWFLIQLKDGRRGWIFRRMIYLYNGDWTKLPVTQAGVEPPAPLVEVHGVALVQTLVRNVPSKTRSDKIGAINQGQEFKILRLSRNRAWVFVDADGLQGWVYLPNVKIVFGNLGRLPVGN
jgi:uncharacterized protein YgiM (DUF1202 family)